MRSGFSTENLFEKSVVVTTVLSSTQADKPLPRPQGADTDVLVYLPNTGPRERGAEESSLVSEELWVINLSLPTVGHQE